MISSWRSLKKYTILAIAIALIVFIWRIVPPTRSQSLAAFPPPKVHPLPESLANYVDRSRRDNYLTEIDKTPLGYLVWSQFPIKIFIDKPLQLGNSAADRRYQAWIDAVEQAVSEWNVYLPLKEISDREMADIIILRSQPKREVKLNPKTGLFDIPRAVTAETTYKFYLQKNPGTVAHKMTIEISPNYLGVSLLATARHELGHALGIWGHSKDRGDALYFSQVGNPTGISSRDVNTLIEIYQQPTRLGWRI